MAAEVYSFAPVIPKGTAIAAGFSSPLTMPARLVERIDIRVPPGPRGTVGFFIGAAKTQVVPVNVGQYIVTDDEKMTFDLANLIQSGAWALYGYNLGGRDHTIFVRFHVALPQDTAATGPSPLLQTAGMTFGS